ncbi:MAG: hypothetical protein RBS82_10720, partial [Syntrophales bacterium]|nr:hypothetical protein [Syntrophales bacterium]
MGRISWFVKKEYLFVLIIFILVLGLPTRSIGDVIYDDVPSYDQEKLAGACSETSIAMVMGWHDTNRFTTNWKRFVPYGGNNYAENPMGIKELASLIVYYLETGGDGMSSYPDWYGAESKFPNFAHYMDSGANFSLDYVDLGGIITWNDIKSYLINNYVGVFGTLSTIEIYSNGGFEGAIADHDMASIGFHENYIKFGITSNWLLVQSTWTQDPWAKIDPLWINWDDIGLFDNLTYAIIKKGGTPSINYDNTDDVFEDNDDLVYAKQVSVPYSASNLVCNDDDFFKISTCKGILAISITFSNSNGNLDLQVYNSSGTLIAESDSIST